MTKNASKNENFEDAITSDEIIHFENGAKCRNQ